MATTVLHDRDLDAGDIGQLGNADAVAGFFAALGYDIGGRLVQTTAALGITAASLERKVRRIERIADQGQGGLQVYLVELDSVTVAAINGLARALRDRAGNYLLVLTSDWEELDFVLIERRLDTRTSQLGGLPRVSVRPRTLSVRRRHPNRVDLRVLRRFTYTESDSEAQFAKLQSGYTVAEWSEPFFNNRGLFSDYYLKERLPSLPEWQENPKPAYQELRRIYTRQEPLASLREDQVRADVLLPALKALGFAVGAAAGRPGVDYLMQIPGASNAVACVAYGWDRYLDGKDDRRDTRRSSENPGAQMVTVLDSGIASWGILTNGKIWRLYSAKAHSRATNYYEIDLEETLALGDPNEAFRYFWLLFRAEAYRSRGVVAAGQTLVASFVERLLEESGQYAHALGDRLKDRIFEDVFRKLARGFTVHIRASEGPDADLSQQRLNQIFQATLTLLYRLLFLLYAESRDLLPVREVRGYWEASLSRLKQQIAEVGGPIAGESIKKLERHYSADPEDTHLFDRLLALAAVVDKGDMALNVPTYNGGLFAAPGAEPGQLDEDAARFIVGHKIPDQFVAIALDFLSRDIDERTQALVPIDYKSLGVRQLGSIYEGLLEFRLRIADQKMAVVKGKRTEEIVPYTQAVKERLQIVTLGRGRGALEKTLSKGEVYLTNEQSERKATGSYYTPDHIVAYIVERTVGSVLKDHLEEVRPVFRSFQLAGGQSLESIVAAADRLFDFRVLDPAMGSGHFLVEAVDFATDRILDFLNGFPQNPVQAQLQATRESILSEMDRQGVSIDPGKLTDVNLLKRHVLKRCIHGVDLNPMAVELAKVSVWLDCFTLGAPLSFLDHHFRCGNSLVGTEVAIVQQAVEPGVDSAGHQQLAMFVSKFAGLRLATDLMHHVGELSDVTSSQVAESKAEYTRALAALAPFKRILDFYTAQWFVSLPTPAAALRGRRHGAKGDRPLLAFIKSTDSEAVLNATSEAEFKAAVAKLGPPDRRLIEEAKMIGRQLHFFHWELEFPEAFYRRVGDAVERREEPGFDVVIGNPPYDVLSSLEIGRDVTQEVEYFRAQPVYEPAFRGKSNLFKLFIPRALRLVRREGSFSFIVPMSLLGDDQTAGVRGLLLDAGGLQFVEVFPQKDDVRKRVFPEAKLATCIFVIREGPDLHAIHPIHIRTHPGRTLGDVSAELEVTADQIQSFDPQNRPIPACTAEDWRIARSLVERRKRAKLGDNVVTFRARSMRRLTARGA